MKIAFVGTHSVGKTTLAEIVERKFKITRCKSDKARILASKIIANRRLDELTDQQQMQLQNLMKNTLQDAQKQEGTFILDCCSLTCGPYATALMNNVFLEENREWFNNLKKETVENAFNNLDYILYIPMEIPLTDDGFRPTSNQLRKKIDDDIQQLLGIKDGHIHPKVRIISGTKEDRVLQLQHLLGVPENNILNNLYTFEGIPRSGKSTIINRIKMKNPEVEICHRIGTTDSLKSHIKTLYEHPEENANELLELHINSFKEHLSKNNVLDKLEEGKTVIVDRSRWTTIMLQLALNQSFSDVALKTNDIPVGNLLLIDTPPNVACRREQRLNDSTIKTKIDFQEKVSRHYLNILSNIPSCNILSGIQKPEILFKQANNIVCPENNLNKLKDISIDKNRRYINTGINSWSPQDILLDLQYQLGNLSVNLLRVNKKTFSTKTAHELKQLMADDLSDILYETLLLSEQLDIDIVNAWKLKNSYDLSKLKLRNDKL